MTFDKLIGQKEVKSFLLETIQLKKVSHAYLFSGAEGTGRKSFAEIFAKYLMCMGNETHPCRQCESCILSSNNTNPDIIRVKRAKKKASIGVDDIRFVQEEIATAPNHSRYKIIVFEEAEKMTVQAQNALLKTLEEPPSYIVIILISSNDLQLLETVKSRTIKIDFKRYTNNEIITVFKEKYPDKDIDCNVLCEYADGIIGRALSMAESDGYSKLCAEIIECFNNLCDGKGKSLCTFEKIISENSESKELLFYVILSVLRDIMVVNRYSRVVSIQNAQDVEKINRISDKIDYHKAVECIEKVNETWKLLQKNVNYKLATDMLVIQLQEVIHG